jgi:hypothetical protein
LIRITWAFINPELNADADVIFCEISTQTRQALSSSRLNEPNMAQITTLPPRQLCSMCARYLHTATSAPVQSIDEVSSTVLAYRYLDPS